MAAQKQYRNPLSVGDAVRIVGEEYHAQVGELRVIDPDADEEAFFGVYLDSTETIVPFRFEDLQQVEAEQEKPHPDACLCDECWAFRFAVCGYDD